MAEDLFKSLANIESMLKDLANEKPLEPHGENPDVVAQREAESPYCIKNGAYIRVEDDGMKAWIFLNPPREGEDFYTKDQIYQFLDENKIVSGFHRSNIAAIVKKHVYGREILVAVGDEPVEGINGYYEYFFETNNRRKPTIREDGTVDYSAMSRLSNVEEGAVIAIYHHSVPSRDGCDVFGNVLATKPPKDLPSLKGKSIKNGKTPYEYVATMSGKIELRDNHIDIKNVHEIRGDVDLVTGKIEFFGDIVIKGNVGSGVVIRASRNVTIEGVVEAATIYAGGDIVITKGIQGGQKGHIVARGNISSDFIELATVEAGGDVHSNTYVNSEVSAAGMVIADGKKGVILGGNTRGLLGVSAMVLGNEAETRTFIASGYSGDDYAKYIDAYQKESDVQKALSDTVDAMTQVLKTKRLGKDINEEKTNRLLLDLNEKKDELFEQLDKVRTEKEELSHIIETGKGSSVVANDKIFRGVIITIEGSTFVVPQNTSFMKYKNEGGKIIPVVINYSDR